MIKYCVLKTTSQPLKVVFTKLVNSKLGFMGYNLLIKFRAKLNFSLRVRSKSKGLVYKQTIGTVHIIIVVDHSIIYQ